MSPVACWRSPSSARWLSGPEPADDGEELADEETVLGRFAAAAADASRHSSQMRLALAHSRPLLRGSGSQASSRLPDARVGLKSWSTVGVWIVDLVTRRHIIAAIPPEQLEELPRWSVLAGAMAPVGGVWHSGAARWLSIQLRRTKPPRCSWTQPTRSSPLRLGSREPWRVKVPRPHSLEAVVVPGRTGSSLKLAPEFGPTEVDPCTGCRRCARASRWPGGTTDPASSDDEEHRRRSTRTFILVTFPVSEPLSVRKRLVAQDDFEGDEAAGGELEEDDVAPPLSWLGHAT